MKLILILLTFISYPVFALDDYKCTINNAATVDSSGELVTIGDKSVIGKMFTVDRKTGAMTGPIKNNYLSEPIVLDYGSSETSFKALNTMKNEKVSNVYTLTIEEFADSTKKPFLFLSNLHIFYGFCEHF